MKTLICPITKDELIYVGYDEGVMDGNSYYSPKSDPSIIFSVHPRLNNIYALVESKSLYSKAIRYFKLKENGKWLEMKRVPHGDELFPKYFNGAEWKRACAEAKLRWQKRQEQEAYWKEHPEEDPRIKAKTISNDKVEVRPMPAPSMNLFYVDFKHTDNGISKN